MAQDEDQRRGAANRLYWESDASVAEIAEKLGLSRRALYDAVHPEPAGAACPNCRAGLVFRTRTSRMLGEVECQECGFEADIETLREATAEAGAAMRRGVDEREASEEVEREAFEEPEREGSEAASSEPADAAAAGRAGRGEGGRRAEGDGLPEADPALRERAAWLGGAALAGAIVGAITAWFAWRR